MRGLAEDTKRLTLNNTNNNNNNTTTKTATVRKTATVTAATSTATATKTGQNLKTTNKTFKMSQQQKQPETKNTTLTKGTGALQKQKSQPPPPNQQKQLTKVQPQSSQPQQPQQKQQQQQQKSPSSTPSSQSQTKMNSQQHNNNATSAAANAANASTTIAIPKASHANTTEEIAGGVQDTIYLCNFRVSVDGEWLCLKELQDIDVSQQNQHKSGNSTVDGNGGSNALGGVGHQRQHGSILNQRYSSNNSSSGGNYKRNSGLSGLHGLEENGILAIQNLISRRFTESSNNSLPLTHMLFTNNSTNTDTGSGEWSNLLRDPAEIERSNLVNICKLVVKELLEQSLRYGRMLDSDHLPLQHFFIVIEHVLGHGLRPKKGLLGPRKELWDLLQSVENYCPEAQDITTSVRDLPTVRTHIGRARAWLRIALMQKKLADYLQALIEHRDDALYEYYEPYALMMSDEIVVIMGILVGLNVIDCNLCVKEEDLDSQQGVIDFSLYLRSSSRSNDNDEETNAQSLEANGEQPNMIAVLDQKNYIEELNRHLNATVTNLQAKIESLTTTNALMKEDLAIARNSLLALQAENQAMRQNATANTGATSLTSVQSDASSNSSSSGNKATIDSLNTELNEERKKSIELEKELKLQVSLKAESDMAMKLLEKDIHEKQDTIVSLRRQLDDIKQINLEMYRKLQEADVTLKHKTDLLSKLELQKEDMANTISQLEAKWCDDKSNLGEILKNTSQTLSTQVTASEERAARAEIEARIEREWRASLQEKEIKLKETISSLQNYVKELTVEVQHNEKLKLELEKVRKQWSEAQTTLEELGIQLSVSKLRVSELEEREKRQQQLQMQSSTSTTSTDAGGATTAGIWAPDSIATHCGGCKKEFNVTRRKHHCRSCGDIFCKACSKHTLPLLNSQGVGKSVRVCDSCYGGHATNK